MPAARPSRSGRPIAPAPVAPTPLQASLGRRSFVPWECGSCDAVLPFPREAEIACPRCGGASKVSARLADRLQAAAANAGDSDTQRWLEHTASAWRQAGAPAR